MPINSVHRNHLIAAIRDYRRAAIYASPYYRGSRMPEEHKNIDDAMRTARQRLNRVIDRLFVDDLLNDQLRKKK